MKKTPVLLTVLMAATIMISCEKEKKNTIHNNIIVPPRQEVVVDTIIHQMNPIDQTDQVKWLGNTYRVSVNRHTSDSLSVVTDNNGETRQITTKCIVR